MSFVSAPNFDAPTDVGANNVYDVQVRVSDGTLTDTQAIAVTVTNQNEAPTITSNGAGATAAITVTENSTAVTTVTASDPDAGATQTYSIIGGADAGQVQHQCKHRCPELLSQHQTSKRRPMPVPTMSTMSRSRSPMAP